MCILYEIVLKLSSLLYKLNVMRNGKKLPYLVGEVQIEHNEKLEKNFLISLEK